MATESELLKAYSDSAAKAGATAPAAGASAGTGATTPASSPQTPQGASPAEPTGGAAKSSTPATDAANNVPSYNNNIMNGAYNTARTDAINQMYDAQRAQREAELKNAYDQSMSAYQEAQSKIAPEYQQKANDLGVQYERNRHNFWNQAAASGINTGVSAQESLARGGEYQRDFGNLRTSEAEQQAAVERQMADRKAQYQNDVAAALAQNDYQRAGALLDEYNNGYQRDLENAKILASYGDFSFYENLYGKEQADAMYKLWLAQNPDLAHNTGRITDAQWENLKNNKNMTDGLDANGNRIVSAAPAASGGGGSSYNYWESMYGTGGTPKSGEKWSPSYATVAAGSSSNPSKVLGEAVAGGKITPSVATNIDYALKHPGR